MTLTGKQIIDGKYTATGKEIFDSISAETENPWPDFLCRT